MIRRLVISTVIFLLTSLSTSSPGHSFRMLAGQLMQTPATNNGISLPPVLSADLDGDGKLESLVLHGRSTSILRGDQVLWSSPHGWDVRQAVIGDLNRDGAPEADLLVWRAFRPWPIDRYLPAPGRIEEFHDVRGQSCQIILIGWLRDHYTERWAGSALAEPVKSFFAADLDEDGFQELITLDARYNDVDFLPGRAVSAWEWNGFGFSLVDRIAGSFSRAAPILLAPGKIGIMIYP